MSYCLCEVFNFFADVLTLSLSFSNMYRFRGFLPLMLEREARSDESWEPFFPPMYNLSLILYKIFW